MTRHSFTCRIRHYFGVMFLLGLMTVPIEAQKTIIIVRHAEKVDDSHNPQLSPRGQMRAQALARHLQDAGINAVYSTGYIRTIDTVSPLAKTLGLSVSLEPIHDINAFSDNAITRYHEALVTQLQRMHQDDVVLIVGHSNSLPGLLQTLGHPESIAITSEEYDNLFVVIPRLGGPPSVLRFRF